MSSYNYTCYTKDDDTTGYIYDCCSEYVHPIFTFVVGMLYNFRHLFYIGLWRVYLAWPPIGNFINSLPNVVAGAVCIISIILCLYTVIWICAPGIYKNIKQWSKVFKSRNKLPLMSLSYNKGATLVRTLDEFICTKMYIESPYEHSYHGVKEFYGFYQDKHTAFKGSVFATIMIVFGCQIEDMFIKHRTKKQKSDKVTLGKKKMKKELANEQAKNEQKAISVLLKEIEKKKKLSEKQINSAIDGINEVLSNE